MRRLLVLCFAVAGCFSPNLGSQPFTCPDHICPNGYECADGVCVKDGTPTADAALGDATESPDTGPGTADASHADAVTSCTPGDFISCATPAIANICKPTGDGTTQKACAYKCDGTAELCEQCNPNSASCSGDNSITCDAKGEIGTTTPCPVGCDPNLGPDLGTCFTLKPRNLDSGVCASLTTAVLDITNDTTINTDNCKTIGGTQQGQSNGAPDICVLVYSKVTVSAGATVTVTGLLPLAVVGIDSVTIDGTIDVSASGTSAGPGAVRDGKPSTGLGTGTGGAGGGFATAGGAGSDGTAGGQAYNSITPDIPLAGGSPGADSGGGVVCPQSCPSASLAGAGGGALQIVACDAIAIGDNALFNAGGGGGAGGAGETAALGSAPVGGGGGGSGGAIFIEAPAISIPSTAIFVAGGGGGGGGGGGVSSGGSAANGKPGDDGHIDGTTALGGHGGDDKAGGGGNGGLVVVPQAGSLSSTEGSGAGGGAAGRIRFDTRAGMLTTNGTVAPSATAGTILVFHP